MSDLPDDTIAKMVEQVTIKTLDASFGWDKSLTWNQSRDLALAAIASALYEVGLLMHASEGVPPHCSTCSCGCTCGYGGFHEPENERCELVARAAGERPS